MNILRIQQTRNKYKYQQSALNCFDFGNFIIISKAYQFLYIQITTIQLMQRFQKPYLHFSIENFLSNEKYAQLVEAYNHLQFIEKVSDLFHFYQTNQLIDQPSVAFFKDQLSRQFEKLQSLQNTSYNIFASYYFKGDYLLCHDDVIEDRKYAFSYYLQDHASADLVLFDETATKAVKRIKVKKNTLVIFQVSNISYHQVALSHQDGRKAVTGWLNQKEYGSLRQAKVTPSFIPNLPKSLTKFQLQQDLTTEQYYSFPGMQYLFEPVQSQKAGPLYVRKATKLILDQYVVLDIKKANLLSVDCYLFEKENYMLLNDPVNNLGEDIIDVFILQVKGETIPDGNFITVIDEEGNVTGGIPYEDNCMFVVNRGKKNYYIDLVEEDIYVCHMIYQKKCKKETKNQPQNNNIKNLRQKLMQHHKKAREQREEKTGKKKTIKKEEKTSVTKGKKESSKK